MEDPGVGLQLIEDPGAGLQLMIQVQGFNWSRIQVQGFKGFKFHAQVEGAPYKFISGLDPQLRIDSAIAQLDRTQYNLHAIREAPRSIPTSN